MATLHGELHTDSMDVPSPETELLYATCDGNSEVFHRDNTWTSVLGRDENIWERLTLEDEGLARRCVEEAASGSLVTHQIFPIQYAGRDEPLPILLSFFPVHTKKGEDKKKVDTVVITGEILAEPESWTKHQTKWARFETLGRMTMGIAHDFNNLLSGILGYTELLKHGAPEEGVEPFDKKSPAYPFLRTIEKAALDGAALVNKIQQFIRQEKKSRFEQVDVRDLIDDCISLTRPYWYNEPRRQGIDIEMNTDMSEVPAVLGSPPELREVFVNLLLNAVQAMPKGGTIDIRLTSNPQKGNILEISDTGIGMTDRVRQKIFEPLFSTKGERGTGMGLSVSHGIIQEHEGTIECMSDLGKGTTFTLTFPHAGPDAARKRIDGEETERSPARLLIVDDEKMVRSVLKKLLKLKGHSVEAVASGYEALDQLSANQFDLVITDHGMPEMNGRQLAVQIREQQPALPLILLTGDTEIDEATDAVDAVLGKPFQVDQIELQIQRLLASE